MVLTSEVESLRTRRIFRVSRSLIRKLPSLSVTRPHGASRSATIARARGSPRDRTVLGVGLLASGLLGAGLAAVVELVWSAVRVSPLGSLAVAASSDQKQRAADSYQMRAAHPMPRHRCRSHGHSLAHWAKTGLTS